MAGIYIHIPFCRQKCHYCNFFSSASKKQREDFLAALHNELAQQKTYLAGETVRTIYFGGGTPSLLPPQVIQAVLRTIAVNYYVAPDPEITLEANPDDLTGEYLQALSGTPVNRLSIGVQSFFDEDLQALNRVHNASQAITVMNKIQDAGYRMSVDLIYGIPGMTDDRWRKNLETVIRCGIPHISAYALTVEEKTTLHWMIEHKKYPPVSEEQAARQYMIIVKVLKEAGYLHYEISNFCLPDFESKHNSNYWKGASYLGVGPSAHSFNGTSRRWNVSNISEYVNISNEGGIAYEEEVLTPVQRYNEYVMTGLRTMWGCKASYIVENFGSSSHDLFLRCAGRHIVAGGMWQVGDRYGLTDEGMLFADGIAAEFFMEHG